MKRHIFALFVLAAALFSAAASAQGSSPAETGAQEGSAGERLKEDFKRLGSDIVDGMNAAGESVGNWFKEQSGKAQENSAGKPGSQSKIGIVLSVNTKNGTITIVTTDGKTATFGTNDGTTIRVQDAVTGLQTPFSGGKDARLKSIRKGDWIHCSYNFGDYVKSVLPDTPADTVVARTIDILR